MSNLKEIIQNLKLVIFDVDGVFTDGSVYVDINCNEMLKFSRIDGRGIYLLRQTGLKTAVITSEDSEIVKARMKKLKIDEIFVNIKDKLKLYRNQYFYLLVIVVSIGHPPYFLEIRYPQLLKHYFHLENKVDKHNSSGDGPLYSIYDQP